MLKVGRKRVGRDTNVVTVAFIARRHMAHVDLLVSATGFCWAFVIGRKKRQRHIKSKSATEVCANEYSELTMQQFATSTARSPMSVGS